MDYFEMERNRYRYRDSGSSALGIGGRISPVIKYLIIINLSVFLFLSVIRLLSGLNLNNIFGLVPYLFTRKLMIWQVATYMFLHAGIFHIFWNLLALWMFGAEVENAMGSKTFLRFYILAGVFAGLCSVIIQFNSIIPVVGASGAIFGILAAFGMLFPDREIMLLIFLIIPVKAKAKYIVLGFAVLTFFQCLLISDGGIAYFAHLGGLLFGFLYFKNIMNIRDIIEGWPENFKKYFGKEHQSPYPISREAYISEEIDPILEKISKAGIHSLTKREKKILEKAKEKL